MADAEWKSNRIYKDRMFIHLFSDKNHLLQLYNAVMGTAYDNPEDLEINTLEGVLFLNMKNDLSLIFHEELSLYEHQSTDCPNMPLRGLLYIGRLYEKFVKDTALYSSKKVRIPSPIFIVFYNGLKEKPAEWTEKLSDAYLVSPKNPKLEFEVRFININYKKNGEILSKCPVLEEYSHFVENVRESQKRLPLQEAIREAIIISKEQGILKDYLQTHGSEVENMLFTEYSREKDIEVNRREAWEEGKEEKLLEQIRKKVSKGQTIPQIAEALEEEPEYIAELIGRIKR